MVKAVALDPFLVTGIDLEKSDDTVIAALNLGKRALLDEFPPRARVRKTATNAAKTESFYQTVANHVISSLITR